MKTLPYALLGLVLASAPLLQSCAAFQAAGEVQRGRMDLIRDDAKSALPRFQRAAEIDPGYYTNFTPLKQGVWTYVGRAHYATDRLAEARQALERAVSRHGDDHMGRLYLGLALARDGERQRGLKEVESGMRGLHDWLEWNENYTSFGRFWDPSRKIRNEIQINLAMISSKEIDMQRLIASGDWVGKKMEEEIDLARRDEVKERTMDGDGGEEP